MIKPRGWQIEALQKFQLATDKNFLLDVTPGAGKTLFSALAASHLFERGAIDFAPIIVPTTVIKGDREAGFLGDWNKAGIQITTVLKDGRDKPQQFRGAVVTYQQLPNLLGTFQIWTRKGVRLFPIFDELHHASEDNTWGTSAERLSQIAVRSLGMTGTCFRGDKRRISFVRYDSDGKAIADHSYGYRNAVTDRICRQVDFTTDDSMTQFMLDQENHDVRVSEASADVDVRGATRTVFRTDHEFLTGLLEKADDALDQYRSWDRDAGGLIICRAGKDDTDNRHLHYIAELVKKLFGEAPEVISYDDADANAKVERFRKSDQRWMCAVRKISEGVDIKRLRILVMATRPTTELLFRQLVGRVVRVDDERRPGTATVFIAKFPQLVSWAKTVADEAEAGLRQQKPGEGHGPGQTHQFTSFGATHEHSGAVSDYGDQFSVDEVNAAERLRGNDPALADISLTTLAYLQRKLGIVPDQAETAEPPLQIRKKMWRAAIVKKARHLAIKRNGQSPDFKRVWREIGATFGPHSADDLCDNYSLEIMRQIDVWLNTTLAGEAHA